jgi:hypothetical protein
VNGGRRVTSSYKVAPRLYTSLRWSTGRRAASAYSGLM